tara:strand:- start:3333 stop:3809 length:477 start_codon:yes stop_codon:yes gene_type:complete
MLLPSPAIHTLRHSVIFTPHYHRPHIPTVGAEGQNKLRRNENHIQRLGTSANKSLRQVLVYRTAHGHLLLPTYGRTITHNPFVAPCPTIPDVKPEYAVLPQHPLNLPTYLDDMGDVEFWSRFGAELSPPSIAEDTNILRSDPAVVVNSLLKVLRPVCP